MNETVGCRIVHRHRIGGILVGDNVVSNKVDSELRAVVAVLGAHGNVPFSGRDRGSVVRLNRQNLGHELVLATRGHLLLSHHAGERILEVCLGVLFDHGRLVLHASFLIQLNS